MAFLKTNNANFYYELHGTGQPIILIAGYACDHTSWLAVLDELAKNFQVLIFDNRAVGQTTDDNLKLTAKLMADDVINLAHQLNLKKPHIIGHSMGGSIAQTVASLYPEKIGKLCLLNSSAKWRKAMQLGFKSIFMMRENNFDLNFTIDSVIPWIYGEKFLSSEENINAVRLAILNNPYPQSIGDQKRQIDMTEEFDGISALKNIKSPTLIAYGKEDIVSLNYEAEFLANQIKDAKLAKFDCAHGIMFEVPQQLTRALIDFLQ